MVQGVTGQKTKTEMYSPINVNLHLYLKKYTRGVQL